MTPGTIVRTTVDVPIILGFRLTLTGVEKAYGATIPAGSRGMVMRILDDGAFVTVALSAFNGAIFMFEVTQLEIDE
jgi:hypothetical protein